MMRRRELINNQLIKEKKKKHKCGECFWLNLNQRSSIGYLCVCPNIIHKGLSAWKQLYKPACRKGFMNKKLIEKLSQ